MFRKIIRNQPKPVISAFVLSRLLIILSALLGTVILGTRTPKPNETLWNIEVPFFNLFARWDSAFYIEIAKNGYYDVSLWAFRPLFPFILMILSLPFASFLYFDISAAILGFLANNLFFLAALILIYKVTTAIYSESIASKTVFFIAFCPMSIFFSAIYTESLYLLLSSLCIYTLEKKKHFKSGLSGFLAGLTRPEGFLLSFPIFIRSFQNGNKKYEVKERLSSIVAASSFIVILAIAQLLAGDYKVVFSTELGWDNLTLVDLISDTSRIKYVLMIPEFLSFYIISIPTTIIGTIAVFSFFFRRNVPSLEKRQTLPYYLYSAIIVIINFAVGDIRNPRLLSTLIPLYWTLSEWDRKKPKIGKTLLILFIILCICGIILFTNWYHFH